MRRPATIAEIAPDQRFLGQRRQFGAARVVLMAGAEQAGEMVAGGEHATRHLGVAGQRVKGQQLGLLDSLFPSG